MRECDAVMSAIPYYFNFDWRSWRSKPACISATSAATPRSCSSRRSSTPTRKAKNITVVPDCGLAPGMVNILAEYGIRQLDTVESVRIFVGGLPQHPEPPLNYQIVYSLEGVLDYYTTLSWVLRNGKRTQVKALSELEPVKFGGGLGELEAFHTAGGLSTMAFRYEGKIPTMEYKTLRYPGHAKLMEDIRELGSARPRADRREGNEGRSARRVHRRGRAEAHQAARRRDLVALRVIVEGNEGRQAARRIEWELVDQLRREARHQRDDADDRLLAVDHGADAGARRGQAGRRPHAGRVHAGGEVHRGAAKARRRDQRDP